MRKNKNPFKIPQPDNALTRALEPQPDMRQSIPTNQATAPRAANPNPGNVEVFKNQTGRLSGVTLPDGRTFLGLSPDEVREISAREEGKAMLPPNAAISGTQQALNEQQGAVMDQQRQAVELRQNAYGTPQPLNPDVIPAGPDVLDVGNIAATTAKWAGAGAAGGAVIGGALAPVTAGMSFPVTAGAGAIGLGAAGALYGLATSTFYSSSTERKQQVRDSFVRYQDATKQMENLIKDVNAGHITKTQARAFWYNEYARILQSERELNAQQNKFMGEKRSKSRDELSKIEAWRRTFPRIEAEFEIALAAPDPNKIIMGIADTTTDTEVNPNG